MSSLLGIGELWVNLTRTSIVHLQEIPSCQRTEAVLIVELAPLTPVMIQASQCMFAGSTASQRAQKPPNGKWREREAVFCSNRAREQRKNDM